MNSKCLLWTAICPFGIYGCSEFPRTGLLCWSKLAVCLLPIAMSAHLFLEQRNRVVLYDVVALC